MEWVEIVIGLLLLVPGLLFAVENWRVWYWNTFKRAGAEPARYYPVVGALLMFWGLGYMLRAEYALWSYLVLLADYGCLPLAVQCLCFARKPRKKSEIKN